MMNRQSFERIQPADLLESQFDESQPPPQRSGPVRGLWNAWLWLTGPRPERFGSGIVGQERLRHSRLISALLLLTAVVMALLIPSALSVPNLWQPMLIQAVLGIVAALLN